MKSGLKNHFNIKKYNSNQKNKISKNEKEELKNINSFRKIMTSTKPYNSNYKTSKNSPDKILKDNLKKQKNSSSNKNFNKINLNTQKLKNKKNESKIDSLLKRKIIKMKEKKSTTMGNTLINNSTSLTNNTFIHNNTSGSLNNNKKTKQKIYKKINQNKVNSSIESEEKNISKIKSERNYLKNKNLFSSSSKHKGIIKTNNFKTIQNKPNNLILQSHLKNNSIFNSTLNSLYKKNNNKSQKFKISIHGNSKTSFPTQSNSRKNSNDKNSLINKSNNSNSNIHSKIQNNKYLKNSPLNNYENNSKKKIKPFNQKAFINVSKIKINENTKSKINSKSNSKEQSKSNSKENIFKKSKNLDKKFTILENILLNTNKNNKKNNNKICYSENSSSQGKITVIKNSVHKNKVITVNEMKKKENEKIEKNKNENNKNIKSIKVNQSKGKKILKEKEKKIKEKEKIPDRDLETEENLKDNLLNYLNSNIDIIPNLNMNESNDSFQSTIKEKEKYLIYLKDKEIISSYIKEYFNKNGIYPSTKIKFYKYGRLLGKGAFGKVNLSLHVLTGRLVAIKSINKSKIISERQKSKIKIETSIMKTLSSSNHIVKLYETYETEKHICIVMEYICAGDLLSYIRKRSKLTEPIAKYIFKQIILAIQYIHNNNIVHRDIKLDNILIDLDNKIKICDFGVSKRINSNDIIFEQCGTPTYIAPEILKNKGYEGFKVDIWSSGVVLYAMLSGTVPFKGNNINDLNNVIMKGDYNNINDISNEANHLLKCILEVDPKKRISINDILSHPWLINVDIDCNYNLFTNAERVLLSKSNVDYRDLKYKDDMIENFNIRNLDTEEEYESKNINTKSIILAPFNSSIILNESQKSLIDNNNNELNIKNNVIKFSVKVKELNRIYELNNNGEIDNGVVITLDSNDKKFYDNISPSPYNNISFYSKGQSKPFSPNNELDENYKKQEKNEINDFALNELVKLGYLKPYIRECLYNNEKNYATASYFLLVKYCY